MTFGGLLAALPMLGLLLGLARVRYPRAPWLGAILLLAMYALFVLSMGGWAASCWDCNGGERRDALLVASVYFGVVVGTTVVGIWLGARFTLVLGRLIGTLRGRD